MVSKSTNKILRIYDPLEPAYRNIATRREVVEAKYIHNSKCCTATSDRPRSTRLSEYSASTRNIEQKETIVSLYRKRDKQTRSVEVRGANSDGTVSTTSGVLREFDIGSGKVAHFDPFGAENLHALFVCEGQV
jgi:hypothetical protein